MKAKLTSAILVIVLASIALVVSIMQIVNGWTTKGIMWLLIVSYWIVLTIKNIEDFRGMKK